MLSLKGQEEEIDHEAMTAEAELQNAMLTLHAGLEIRSITIQLLFGRLHAFPKAQITKSLRTGLQLRDLVFFIHLLRMELYSAGWTRPYVELNEEVLDGLPPVYEAADDEDAPSDRAVRTIGNLMLAAVDAIGIVSIGRSGSSAASSDPFDHININQSAVFHRSFIRIRH